MVTSAQTIFLFGGACLGLLVAPGPNMALVVSQGLAHGARGGVAVASGIVIADLVLTALVACGAAAMLAAWPLALDALRFGGAAYLTWLALNSFRSTEARGLPQAEPRGTRAIVELSVLTSLLNPKALLFFVVFLPQFVEPERGQVTLQLALLGCLLSAIAFVFHALLGVASARATRWATGDGPRAQWARWLQGLVFLGLAIRLLLVEVIPHW